jgi:hypothetical protein
MSRQIDAIVAQGLSVIRSLSFASSAGPSRRHRAPHIHGKASWGTCLIVTQVIPNCNSDKHPPLFLGFARHALVFAAIVASMIANEG